MTDKDFDDIRAKIAALSEVWLPNLGLLWWEIRLLYYDDTGEYAKAGKDAAPVEPGQLSLATTYVDWEYAHASIHFNCPELAVLDGDALEKVFIHECCHILVHEMRDVWDNNGLFHVKHEERVVTTLTKAFLWTKAHFAPAKPPDEEKASADEHHDPE